MRVDQGAGRPGRVYPDRDGRVVRLRLLQPPVPLLWKVTGQGDARLYLLGYAVVIAVSVLFDLLLTPFVLPPVMTLFRSLEPDRVLA